MPLRPTRRAERALRAGMTRGHARWLVATFTPATKNLWRVHRGGCRQWPASGCEQVPPVGATDFTALTKGAVRERDCAP